MEKLEARLAVVDHARKSCAISSPAIKSSGQAEDAADKINKEHAEFVDVPNDFGDKAQRSTSSRKPAKS